MLLVTLQVWSLSNNESYLVFIPFLGNEREWTKDKLSSHLVKGLILAVQIFETRKKRGGEERTNRFCLVPFSCVLLQNITVANRLWHYFVFPRLFLSPSWPFLSSSSPSFSSTSSSFFFFLLLLLYFILHLEQHCIRYENNKKREVPSSRTSITTICIIENVL